MSKKGVITVTKGDTFKKLNLINLINHALKELVYVPHSFISQSVYSNKNNMVHIMTVFLTPCIG